jgi:preprotein translocase subunit YajC
VEPVVAAEEPSVVPDDASSLTTDKLGAEGTDASTPVQDAPRNETPEETLRRLNDEGKKDS